MLTSLHAQRVYEISQDVFADKTTGIKCGQIEMLKMYKSIKAYPDKLRRIKFYNKELERICLHH